MCIRDRRYFNIIISPVYISFMIQINCQCQELSLIHIWYTAAYGGELVNWVGPDGTAILTVPVSYTHLDVYKRQADRFHLLLIRSLGNIVY